MTAGYSQTPLAKKLNLRDGHVCWFEGMPESVMDEIDEYALELSFVAEPSTGIDAAHIFVTEETDLAEKLTKLRLLLDKKGQIWVSWPKKASGTETEVDEHAVRKAGLDIGFVDTKKCAVDETWSGLRFACRKS